MYQEPEASGYAFESRLGYRMRPYLKSNITLVNYKDKVINLNDAEIKIRNRKRCNFNTS